MTQQGNAGFLTLFALDRLVFAHDAGCARAIVGIPGEYHGDGRDDRCGVVSWHAWGPAMTQPPSTAAIASVIIPAHNEARGILRTLERLYEGVTPDELDVVLVCNGCTDDTAARVRAHHRSVRVIEIPEPSKAAAVAVGNAAAAVCPRVHLDADVQLSGASLRALIAPLRRGEALATAPRRVLDRTGSSLMVRWYYDVWERLPQVRGGLFGRGVFALSAEGQRRVSSLPALMSDDLAVSEAFAADERSVIEEASVVVVPPRTLRDLVRRRVRVATGIAQASAVGACGPDSQTSLGTLARLGVAEPRLAARIPVFVSVAVIAKVKARPAIRAGDFTTWLRDESSRA
jgi:Glycosyl transferase family 2